MPVYLEKCSNYRCGHLFEVEHFSRSFGNGFPSGIIECPHCGRHWAGKPSLVYLSRKLARDLEAWPEEGA